MSWDDGKENLRTLLSDGPTDKLRAIKAVFGMQNGANQTYKTFEFRRVTNFASSAIAFPLGISVDGELQPYTEILSDDPDSGFFRVNTAYADNVNLTATYYIQWFTDTELDGFLIRASDWLGFTNDYTQIPLGLKTSALKYAAHEAYQKLALRFAETASETFRLEDAPDEKRMEIIKAYQEAAKQALSEATKYRDDYYTRKGQSLSPRFGVVQGNMKNPTVS